MFACPDLRPRLRRIGAQRARAAQLPRPGSRLICTTSVSRYRCLTAPGTCAAVLQFHLNLRRVQHRPCLRETPSRTWTVTIRNASPHPYNDRTAAKHRVADPVRVRTPDPVTTPTPARTCPSYSSGIDAICCEFNWMQRVATQTRSIRRGAEVV